MDAVTTSVAPMTTRGRVVHHVKVGSEDNTPGTPLSARTVSIKAAVCHRNTDIIEWGFRYPGIKDVEHVYFYAATSATPELVKQYFQQAYELGRDFERPAAGAGHSTSAA